MVVLIQGCVSLPTDVIMPQWDTNFNIPITSKIYTLNDIIKSQNYISINPQDNTYLIASDSLNQTIPISQFIQINSERSAPTVLSLQMEQLLRKLFYYFLKERK